MEVLRRDRLRRDILASGIRIGTNLSILCGGLAAGLLSPGAWAQSSAGVVPAGTPGAEASAPQAIDIWEFYVSGNTVLDEATIGRVVLPYLGLHKTPDDVDKARAALEEAYRQRGYKTVAVAIPQQMVRDGVVRLEVVESRVGHLTVVGPSYHSVDQIKAEVPSLAEGKVPDFAAVQQDLVAVNQQPDRKVVPSLKAGAAPGTVDVDLAVEDSLPLHGSVELNNRKSQDTSELRTAASLSYDNLWQLGHSLSLSYQTAPENQADARVYYGSYLARFGASPFSLLVSALKSDSNVATVGGTEVLGRGHSFGIRGIWSLSSSESVYQSLSFGVDYKHFRNLTAVGGSSFETPVTYYPFTLDYTAVQRGDSGLAQLDLSVGFASPTVGSDTLEFQVNRAYARGQQLWLRESFSIIRELPHGLQGFVRLGGQITDQPLITNEQFSQGGMDSVRGYLESEALGDLGISGTLELRSPLLAKQVFNELRLFAFVDGAELKLRQPLPDQAAEIGLGSFGTGFNLKFHNDLNGALVWADPFRTGPATNAWSSRVLFRIWSSF